MNRQSEALRLSEDLITDIELSRTGPSQIVLKAARLARLIEDDEASEWLGYELGGYRGTETGHKYMTKTGRWTEIKERKGYWSSLGDLAALVKALEGQQSSLSSVSLSGDMLLPAQRQHISAIHETAQQLSRCSAIISSVVAQVYQFATRVHYGILFGETQETFFATIRHEVDSRLASLAGDHLKKIESIIERLRAGDTEATSHAMTTCRRLIDTVADALFPPQEDSFVLEDVELSVKKNNVLNRLQAHVFKCEIHKDRRNRLRRTLADIYSRTSSGVHATVSIDEARYVFIQTYIVLGEVIALRADWPDVESSELDESAF